MPPFMRINGAAIAVTAEDTTERRMDIGRAGRAFSGRPDLERRATFRIWSGASVPLTEDESLAQIGAIRGDGEVWPFDVDLFSAGGLGSGLTAGELALAEDASDNKVVGPSGFEERQYGDSSLWPSPVTTNLLLTNSANPETTSGWTAVGGIRSPFFICSLNLTVSHSAIHPTPLGFRSPDPQGTRHRFSSRTSRPRSRPA